MSPKSRILSASLTLLCLSACNSGDNNSSLSVASPGHQTVQSGGTDLTTQCDGLRKQGRHETLQALGIDMLEKGSDQILSQMSSADYKEIEEDAPIATAAAQQEIDKIITDATQAAKLDWTTLQLGAETHRKLLLGNPDYLDKQGCFSVGSTTVDDENALRVGDADNAFLVLSPDTSDSAKSFLAYKIDIEVVSSLQKDANGHLQTTMLSMLDYVENDLLPAMCAGVSSNLNSSNFNTVPVNSQN